MRPASTLAVLLTGTVLLQWADPIAGGRVRIQGRRLFVNDEPFLVRGICYSPTPINESVYFEPYGDYFTAEYSFVWLRDLPLIKAMGANVLRIYGWQPQNDHSAFLDAAGDHGLYVMATYFMGEVTETPVLTWQHRKAAVDGFRHEVARYASHPSLLFWSFGNELNGVWNGFLTEIGKDPNQPQCHWDERYDTLGGCWVHDKAPALPGTRCYEAATCVYARLFSWINDAAVAAKQSADVLVTTGFADVDAIHEKVGRFGHLASDIDAWSAQVYRGASFYGFFEAFGNNTDKPVILTEYGVDAYHDQCGKKESTPCYNTVEDTLLYKDVNGSYVDGDMQAEYALNLTAEIVAAASHGDECDAADHSTPGGKCACLGGFLMSWTDEFWKGAKSQAKCVPTIRDPAFTPLGCMPNAHVTCGNWDATAHDLCGYWLESAPDHYVNEEWFGITTPTACASAVNSLRPREVYWAMRELWTGQTERNDALFAGCDDLLTGHCIALGDGGEGNGGGSWFWGSSGSGGGGSASSSDGGNDDFEGSSSDLVGDHSSGDKVSGGTKHRPPPCSGHGKCTTDWTQCGAGSRTELATPCCSCEPGYAGVGCTELDVRVYIGLAAGALLGGLLVLMLAFSLLATLRMRVMKPSLVEPLLAY